MEITCPTYIIASSPSVSTSGSLRTSSSLETAPPTPFYIQLAYPFACFDMAPIDSFPYSVSSFMSLYISLCTNVPDYSPYYSKNPVPCLKREEKERAGKGSSHRVNPGYNLAFIQLSSTALTSVTDLDPTMVSTCP